MQARLNYRVNVALTATVKLHVTRTTVATLVVSVPSPLVSLVISLNEFEIWSRYRSKQVYAVCAQQVTLKGVVLEVTVNFASVVTNPLYAPSRCSVVPDAHPDKKETQTLLQTPTC